MNEITSIFRYDPIKLLISSGNEAIICFTNKDILNKEFESKSKLFNLAQVQKILKKQKLIGCWEKKLTKII